MPTRADTSTPSTYASNSSRVLAPAEVAADSTAGSTPAVTWVYRLDVLHLVRHVLGARRRDELGHRGGQGQLGGPGHGGLLMASCRSRAATTL
jgi:hypothetical protein